VAAARGGEGVGGGWTAAGSGVSPWRLGGGEEERSTNVSRSYILFIFINIYGIDCKIKF
jgi:hypothetical protein